jgi:hypothetical protein
MESKPLKTDVCFNKNIFCETFEQPIDADFLLPDYCPDISKIFKCKAKPVIISKGVNGKSITIEGNVCITLLYCDKDNNLCSYEYIYPFSKIKEMGEAGDECNIVCTAFCDYINCRAITGRKIDVHGAVSIKIKVFKRCSNKIVSDYDDNEIQLKRIIAPATIPMGYREKMLILEEEIGASNNQNPVLRILRYDAVPNITEYKVLADKVVAKGEMAVNILYTADGVKAPLVFKTTVPFSQIVEMAGVTELCRCDIKAEIVFLEIRPAISYNGDNNGFTLNAKVLLKCESYCVNDIAVIEDAFSTKFETNIVKDTLSFKRICENLKETCQVKKKIELQENITSVIDIWCEKGSKKIKFEKGNICISAVLLVCMVVCDQNDNILFYEKPIEFEHKHPIDCEDSALSANIGIDIANIGFTIVSANCLEVRLELSLTGAVFEQSDIPLITDIEIDTQKPHPKNQKGGMIICFANKGENLWNVARKYNANLSEIMKINGIEKENIDNKKMILVPFN